MSKVGVILSWENNSTKKKDLKKAMIEEYVREFKTLENFLDKSIVELEEVNGVRAVKN